MFGFGRTNGNSKGKVPTSRIAYVKSIVTEMDLSKRDQVKMNKFWQYFQKTWLPLMKFWNVLDKFDGHVKLLVRTNNGIERYNKKLNSLFNTNMSSLLNFIDT